MKHKAPKHNVLLSNDYYHTLSLLLEIYLEVSFSNEHHAIYPSNQSINQLSISRIQMNVSFLCWIDLIDKWWYIPIKYYHYSMKKLKTNNLSNPWISKLLFIHWKTKLRIMYIGRNNKNRKWIQFKQTYVRLVPTVSFTTIYNTISIIIIFVINNSGPFYRKFKTFE